MSGLDGLIMSRLIILCILMFHVKPVTDHVAPLLVDFITPTLYVSVASLSPVAMYMTVVSVGFMAMSLTPITGRLSVLVVQLVPPFVDFQSPPAGAPAQTIFPLRGLKRIQFILPTPPPEGTALIGPINVQLPAEERELSDCCFFHSL